MWSSFHVTGPVCTIKSRWLCDSLLANLCITSGRLLSHGTQRHENKCSECTQHALQTHMQDITRPRKRKCPCPHPKYPQPCARVLSANIYCSNFHAQIGTTAETAAANSGCIKKLLPKLAFPESHLVCFVEVGRVE